MAKISFDEYLAMLRDPDVPDEKIMAYSAVRKGDGAFAPEIHPDPDKVIMTEEEQDAESAMRIGNGFARWRRKIRFHRALNGGDTRPVLVSEGDSWFQFPLLISEVIDHLGEDYLIRSVGAAGDTAQNMVYGRPEYIKTLRQEKERVRGFLFSAAGNDIIGEDPETERPVLLDVLRPFNGDVGDVIGHINFALLAQKLDFLRKAYTKVIDTVRAEPNLERLPIFVHGYDYVFPYPWGENDDRNPIYAAQDEWLGAPLSERGIMDHDLRRNILRTLIDALYQLLEDIAGDSAETGIWLIDCRGAMPIVTDWKDEIHGTSDGFSKVAVRFKATISDVLAQAGPTA